MVSNVIFYASFQFCMGLPAPISIKFQEHKNITLQRTILFPWKNSPQIFKC